MTKRSKPEKNAPMFPYLPFLLMEINPDESVDSRGGGQKAAIRTTMA